MTDKYSNGFRITGGRNKEYWIGRRARREAVTVTGIRNAKGGSGGSELIGGNASRTSFRERSVSGGM